MLKKRVITAACVLPLVTAAVWFGEPWFGVLVAIWAVIAAYEFYRLVAVSKVQPLTYFGLAWVALFVLRPYFNYDYFNPLLITSTIMVPLNFLLLRKRKDNAFASWAWTLGGIFYIGWLLSYYILLRGPIETRGVRFDGRNWVFLAVLATFASDTSAFFVGRKWGRHHLAPTVSPKKTWEGAAAGLVSAVVVGLLFMLPTPLQLPLNYGEAIVLGLLISAFGQVGDLVKSLFKRNMGVKDSSNLLPGHGGFLDRIDSIVFAGVVVYYYVVWVMIIPR